MTLVNKTFSQLITFTRASSATFVGSNGLIQTATTNTPRFDYDPVTLAAKGLLIEEQRTNLLTYSEYFDNAIWSKGTAGLVTPDAAVSPDGSLDADAYTWPSGSGSFAFLSQSVTGNATTTHTFSIWLKRPSGSGSRTLRLVLSDISLSTAQSPTVTVTEQWQRFEFSRASANNTGSIGIGLASGTSGVSMAAGEIVHVWGAQLEAGSFATSYIPTVASQVTRAADVASVNTLSPWYNATEGTFYAEFAGMNNSSGIYGRAIGYDGPRAFISGDGAVNRVASWNNAVNLIASFSGNVLTGAKAALAYSGAGRALVGNGGTVATDANLIGSVTTVRLGNSETTNNYLNGHIRRITYYKRRLSNADLQSITL